MSAPHNYPAFPWTGLGLEGMSLRDYFAAKAMLPLMEHSGGYWSEDSLKHYAIISYRMADAMLEARSA